MTTNSIIKTLLITAVVGCSMIPAPSQATDKLAEAFENGKAYINFRYRYEHVDQTGLGAIVDEANASTLRTNLGYETGAFMGVSGKIEIQNVTHVGGTNFNDTTNGATTRPVVADPELTEVNEAYLQYSGYDTTLKVGRQKINLGNQRFVGTVGWRQNDQTYDAVTISNESIPGLKLFYGYTHNVQRIFAEDSVFPGSLESDTHIGNVTYSGLKDTLGEVTGYYYRLNFDEAGTLNSETYGLNLKGSQKINEDSSFHYYTEWASQSDGDINPVNYDADYYHVNPSFKWKNLTLKAGYEVLEADASAGIAFSTPLATLHKFNGTADLFLNTPAGGIEDMYVGFQYKIDGVNEYIDGAVLDFVYHRFDAEVGTADYGDEFDISLKKKFADNYYVQLKYADFNADSSAPAAFVDTEKFWLTVGANFDLLKPKNQVNK